MVIKKRHTTCETVVLQNAGVEMYGGIYNCIYHFRTCSLKVLK